MGTPVEQLPLPLLVVLIVAAVIAGLWLGYRAGKALPERRDGKPAQTIGERVRSAAGSGVVKLWKWNRARKQPRDDER